MLRSKARTSSTGDTGARCHGRRRPRFHLAGPVPWVPGAHGREVDGGVKTGSAVCIPTPIQATERGLLKVQNPKLAPRSDPTPLHPLGPAPGQYLQVCEIIQALIWSEHVQQPNHLGRRPEHQVGWGLPPQAGTVLQAGKPPAAVPMSLPCPQGQLCPLAAPPSLAHLPTDTGYFWMVTAGVLGGGAAPSLDQLPAIQGAPVPWPFLPLFLSPLKTCGQGGDGLPGEPTSARYFPGRQHQDQAGSQTRPCRPGQG